MTAKKDLQFFNKKARFDYHIDDVFEAGLVLTGQEIKAIRNGRVNLTGSYVKILNSEIFWLGGELSAENVENQRTRKLLLHRSEISKLIGKTNEKGLSLIPLKLYVKKGKAKLEVGIGIGLKKYDKREISKKKDQQREIRIDKMGY
ncbi:MAG: SsrA-binding protein SmpB [bacterium]